MIEQAALIELRLIELGAQVMMIKNKPRAIEELKPQSNEKNEIRGVACMDEVEATFFPHPLSQAPLRPQRKRIFPRIAQS